MLELKGSSEKQIKYGEDMRAKALKSCRKESEKWIAWQIERLAEIEDSAAFWIEANTDTFAAWINNQPANVVAEWLKAVYTQEQLEKICNASIEKIEETEKTVKNIRKAIGMILSEQNVPEHPAIGTTGPCGYCYAGVKAKKNTEIVCTEGWNDDICFANECNECIQRRAAIEKIEALDVISVEKIKSVLTPREYSVMRNAAPMFF